MVLGVGCEHGVDDASKLVSGSFDGDLWTVLGLDSSIVSTESAFAMVETSGSKSERQCSTAGSLLGFVGKDFAAGDFIVRREPQPRGVVFRGGPLAVVYAGLGKNHLHGDSIEPIDLREVDTAELVQAGAQVIGRILSCSLLRFGCWWQRSYAVGRRPCEFVESVQAVIAVENLFGVEVIELESLCQLEEMLVEVGAFKGFDDVSFSAPAVGVTVLGENPGVAFTSHNGAKDGQTSRAGDVADNVVELEVHLV